MEKNMQVIQPRTLSNSELINHCASLMEQVNELPTAYQIELLRRFTALAPLDEFPFVDPKQLDLFLDTK
jgi:hypothetical protein